MLLLDKLHYLSNKLCSISLPSNKNVCQSNKRLHLLLFILFLFDPRTVVAVQNNNRDASFQHFINVGKPKIPKLEAQNEKFTGS